MIVPIIRALLTTCLMFLVYLESGPYTAIALSLAAIHAEFQYRFNGGVIGALKALKRLREDG